MSNLTSAQKRMLQKEEISEMIEENTRMKGRAKSDIEMMIDFVKIDFERLGKKSSIVNNLLSTFEEQIEDSNMVDITLTKTLDHIREEAKIHSDATVGRNSRNFNLSIQNFVKNFDRFSGHTKAIDNLLKQFDKKYSEFHNMSKVAVKDTQSILFESTNKILKITKKDFEEELDGILEEYKNVDLATKSAEHDVSDGDKASYLGKRTPMDMIPKMLEELKKDSDHLMISSPVREEGFRSPTLKKRKGEDRSSSLKKKNMSYSLVPIDVDMSDDVEDPQNEQMEEEEENAIKDFKPLYNHQKDEDNYQNNVSKVNLERLKNSHTKINKKQSFL